MSNPLSRVCRSRLRLEALETRALPSASGFSGIAVHPDLEATPLGNTGAGTPYTPAQIRHAYGFDNLSYDGGGQTVAVVAAYDDPNVFNDLKQFDKQFGLPDPAFRKDTPQGQLSADSGWAAEIALDVEWAHAVAPRAGILLVEAKTSGSTDLLNAVDYARRQPGVSVVSMSWGSPEYAGETGSDGIFTTPPGHNGVVFVASSGDGGAANGPEWPSVSPNVLAVGGTALNLSGGSYGGETGWSGAGGGYSKYEKEPDYQQAAQKSGARTDPDVAFNADPATGVYVYNSYDTSGSLWFRVGGTSAGAPQWAGLVALADQARGARGPLSNLDALIYALPAADFHDITSGNNTYSAAAGYDLVTGRGTPYADRVARDLAGLTASPAAVARPASAVPAPAPVRPHFQGTSAGVVARLLGDQTRPGGAAPETSTTLPRGEDTLGVLLHRDGAPVVAVLDDLARLLRRGSSSETETKPEENFAALDYPFVPDFRIADKD